MWIISPKPSMAHRYLMAQVWMTADRINDFELYSVDGYPMSGMPPPFDDFTCHRTHANTNGSAGWEMEDLEFRLCYGAIWRSRSG